MGKSTWINAFANYCLFDTLEEAAKAGGFFPIPFNFKFEDPQTGEEITQAISSSEGELSESIPITKTGESVTKNPNEYVFRYGNCAINLIDTPGLLSTRDVGTCSHETDKKHVDNILKLLSSYQEIHAIFILMQANEPRLSESFQYTLTEIFKRLDKSACNNVIFIFTFASNFTSPKTQSVLRQFLKDKNLPIVLPPAKPTIYYFENGSVDYLAESLNGIPRDKDSKTAAQTSWRKSVKTTKELLDHVCSLEPHVFAHWNHMLWLL